MDPGSQLIMTSALDPDGSGANREFQVVKCVVVGDTGVGKTRLICSRACGNTYTLPQLMTTHVPTVWAIDAYRKDREILNRSWCTVDGLNISLRLWDTFGYHDKDRRFAYGRADVILVCFSAVRPRSLRSVYHHWFPEIQRLCPDTPIILCATQIDLRFLYNEPEFLDLDKGPFFREIKGEDIQPPDRGRAVAKEIGAHYYESSVLLGYGIEDVFMNVIRAALIHKRDKHFWNHISSLRRIINPFCQAPYQPPKPACPDMVIPPPSLDTELMELLDSQTYADVTFVVQGITIKAHQACLLAASPVFEELFQVIAAYNQDKEKVDDRAEDNPKDVYNDSFLSVDGLGDMAELADSPRHFSRDTAALLDHEELKSPTETKKSFPSSTKHTQTGIPANFTPPAFCASVEQKAHQQDVSGNLETIITLHNSITPRVFNLILKYLYSETSPDISRDLGLPLLLELHKAAELIGIKDLVYILNNILNNESFMNKAVLQSVQFQRCQRRRELLVKKGLLSDVVFQLEDGSVKAHKALLLASCDVMAGMFSVNFREHAAKEIAFPGVTREVFVALQDFLYTGQCPSLSQVDCIELIELANRLCLNRLVALTETYVINELTTAEDSGKDIVEDVVLFIEPAQLHNASQLASWCQWFLCCRYTQVYRNHCKLLQTLRPDNQVYLAKHRWPPVWYMKEVDFYEKCIVDFERLRQKPIRSYLRRGSDDISSGCLGFCGRRNRKLKCEPSPTTTVVT